MLPSWSDRVVAAVAGLGMFLAALDISVNVALPSIAKGLDADLQSVQWVIVAFVATRAGLVMGAGSFADRFGLRRVFIFGAVSYLVAMVTISLSPNLESVVGFRVLQGFGVGSFFAVSPALAARVFPADRRGLAMGFATGSQALGMLAGTLGAGLLIHWFGWQVVFWGRTPFVLLALLLAVRFMSLDRISREPGPSGDETAGRSFDAIGAITLMGALLCLVIGLRLGRSEGWGSPVVLALLCMAPLLIAGFWRTEGRAAWPVLPGWLLKNRGFTVSCTSMFLAHFGVFVVWFVFPFYIYFGLGKGSGSLGAALAAMALFYTGLSGFGGWVCDRLGTGVVGLLGMAVLAAGLLFVSFFGPGIPAIPGGPGHGGGGIGPGPVPIGGLRPDVEQRPNRPHGHRVGGPVVGPSRRDRVFGSHRRGYPGPEPGLPLSQPHIRGQHRQRRRNPGLRAGVPGRVPPGRSRGRPGNNSVCPGRPAEPQAGRGSGGGVSGWVQRSSLTLLTGSC